MPETAGSFFSHSAVPLGPDDPLLGTFARYLADKDPRKVNLGVGAYRDSQGDPVVLDCVLQAEREITQELEKAHGAGNAKELKLTVNKEYNRIDGWPALKPLCQKLIFGPGIERLSADVANAAGTSVTLSDSDARRVCSIQTISGTGALRLGAEFIGRFLGFETMYISNPTWGLEKACFEFGSGKDGRPPIKTEMYPYWNPQKKRIEIEPLLEHLQERMDSGRDSLYVLQPCGHNPTGMDPNLEEWERIVEIVKKSQGKGQKADEELGRIFVVLDCAYQGFASGSLEADRKVIEMFLEPWAEENSKTIRGLEFFVCQSFSKSLGLYGERVGMLHAVCANEDNCAAVLSQLKILGRAMYSNPPIHGALIASKVLSSVGEGGLFDNWKQELRGMSARLGGLRKKLRAGLEESGTPMQGGDDSADGDSCYWRHITDQIGMFSFTGLSEEQCDALIRDHHIYLMRSGRISLSGLNDENIQYVVDCFDQVVRKYPATS